MVRFFAVMLILVVVGTAAFFGWRSQHRTEADAFYDQAQATVGNAVATVMPSDK